MRPEDIEKLFNGKIPEWMKKEEEEPAEPVPAAEEGLQIQAQSPLQTVAICAVTGSIGGQRFQVFYKREEGQETDPTIFDLVLSPEEYLDKYEGFTKDRKRPRGIRWQVMGEVKAGTVLKLFMGQKPQLNNRMQGMQYFITDPNVDIASFYHPHERELFIRGRIRILEERELDERSIAVPKLKYLQAVQ